MFVWLVRGGGRNVLVDTGFYRPQLFSAFKVADYVRPDEAVARAGVRSDEVTDVVLTHMHWDHADGADLFPNATVWIQRDEYAYYTGEAWQGGPDWPDAKLGWVQLTAEGGHTGNDKWLLRDDIGAGGNA